MVTLLITAVLIVSVFAVAVYFWQKPANKSENIELPTTVAPASLFPSTSNALQPSSVDDEKLSFLARAKAGDLTVLVDARNHNSYLQVLESIVAARSSNNTIHTLAAFITENDFRTERSLIDAATASWEVAPDRQLTIQLVHLAALSDDAALYDATVNRVLSAWRQKRLNISNVEIISLITSEYWLLSSKARSSGDGFILKRTLSSARRELEGTT